MRDTEVEIEMLKSYITDLKGKVSIYVPFKDDSIDMKIAEFINNYPERNKLKVMMMRVSPGVYDFGTRRVVVRIEKNRIQIRVGGGFMGIEQFLEQHTSTELQKLEKRDPLKKYNGQNSA